MIHVLIVDKDKRNYRFIKKKITQKITECQSVHIDWLKKTPKQIHPKYNVVVLDADNEEPSQLSKLMQSDGVAFFILTSSFKHELLKRLCNDEVCGWINKGNIDITRLVESIDRITKQHKRFDRLSVNLDQLLANMQNMTQIAI